MYLVTLSPAAQKRLNEQSEKLGISPADLLLKAIERATKSKKGEEDVTVVDKRTLDLRSASTHFHP